ncbi:MAG: C-terminal processing peptidase-3, partial [Sediminibacterium sp.]|nr:C-terminal processing peptidase-3 [Sediminibacterium sp.]
RKDTIPLTAITPKDKTELLKRIQSLMARQIWRNEGYFEVANRHDSTILKASTYFKR